MTDPTNLGQQPDWLTGHNGCTFNPVPDRSPTGDCGRPASLHIRLRDDLGYVAACTEHSGYALASLPAVDWHAWGVWCNMPGALWYPSPVPGGADSRCVLDDSAEEPALAGAVEAAP